jgi:hypothetical protein
VSAIYVLAGDERVGPFTIEEIRDKMGQGIFTPENLGWQEGLETWVPVISLIPDEEAAEETEPLHESRQCTLTKENLEFGGQVIPLDEMASVEVEAEHTKRSRPVVGIIIFTLLLLMLLFSPLHLVASNALIVRIVGGVIPADPKSPRSAVSGAGHRGDPFTRWRDADAHAAACGGSRADQGHQRSGRNTKHHRRRAKSELRSCGNFTMRNQAKRRGGVDFMPLLP